MSETSPPDASLRQWPSWPFIILTVLLLPVIIAGHIFLLVAVLLPHFPRGQLDEIILSPQHKILFICFMVPGLSSFVRGYISSNFRAFNWQERAEGVVSLESTFKVFSERTRRPFVSIPPEEEIEFAKAIKRTFARYLANPYHSDKYSIQPCFSRRLHIYWMASCSVSTFILTSMPFKEWSKLEDETNAALDIFMQGLGWFCVGMWWWFVRGKVWNVGWALKMGSIARQIRRECIKNGCVKESEEDVEKSEVHLDAKERLEWWIRETWEAGEDGHDTSQSELIQM